MPTKHLQALLDEVVARHYPHAPATPAQIAAFEARVGWSLDDELRALYLRCDGAALFKPRPRQTYRVLSLREIQRAGAAMRPGQDEAAQGSSTWWTLVSLGDDDYNLIDVARPTPFAILDAFHESYPRQVVEIAPSFAVWLERTLRSDNQLWWLPAHD
ncbi:SMI1/KNR4 family protein [Myxococcus sp. MISCRS1]|uniref:SMI1/KNR4 family protein n=1 Tax=Myxococcus sp. MISCRS1 TaxID=2996786 RepID=UPI00226E57AE|nr:SMI1/KNR4 family protein [Myxococcus sp. MISCRS1]MCY1003708.1 SMI1/KNR4 family protein [Myxococcus sp. MISCRS1]